MVLSDSLLLLSDNISASIEIEVVEVVELKGIDSTESTLLMMFLLYESQQCVSVHGWSFSFNIRWGKVTFYMAIRNR